MIPDGCDLILTGDFLTESRELLESAESALLNLESDPDDVEAINTVFRAFHTIKGTSAYLGLAVVATFSHNAESLLTRMRDRTIRCAGGYASLALQSVDVLSDLLRRVQLEMEGTPPLSPPDLAPLEARLAHPETFGISDQERRVAWRVLADHKQEATPGPTRGSHRVDGSVRVGTDRLDRLIEMAGELVIAQSLLAQDDALENSADPSLARKLAHSTKIVRELHTLTMSLRMIPLRSTLQKLKRLARDVAHRTGKLVTFDCVGEDTEVDKALVEMISDPLMHLLRNAIDHGIETPPERAAAGKDAAGHIAVHAYQTGGSVVVELTDDGRGLDRSRIVRKAEQMGLISADRQLTDTEVWPLILAPGFSTAEQVTEFSGRGVGLDVVKRSIGSMHGSVDIESTAGQGSRFTIRVPLTLAITDAMLSRVAHERYIIPTVHIRFSFRPALGALRTVVGRGEVVLLREEVLPIVRLHRVFGVDGAVENPDDAILIVVSDGTTRAALMVDELLGQHQVVAKSLGRGLPSTPGISGGAILGDARVGLIIDVHAILAALRAGARPVRAVA
jgi:two-component system chemotaxis sensor kinase CheA